MKFVVFWKKDDMYVVRNFAPMVFKSLKFLIKFEHIQLIVDLL